MTTTTVFVRRHKAAQLPLKYVRKSVTSFFHRDLRTTDIDELEQIQDQFARFIETPVRRQPKED